MGAESIAPRRSTKPRTRRLPPDDAGHATHRGAGVRCEIPRPARTPPTANHQLIAFYDCFQPNSLEGGGESGTRPWKKCLQNVCKLLAHHVQSVYMKRDAGWRRHHAVPRPGGVQSSDSTNHSLGHPDSVRLEPPPGPWGETTGARSAPRPRRGAFAGRGRPTTGRSAATRQRQGAVGPAPATSARRPRRRGRRHPLRQGSALLEGGAPRGAGPRQSVEAQACPALEARLRPHRPSRFPGCRWRSRLLAQRRWRPHGAQPRQRPRNGGPGPDRWRRPRNTNR